MLLWTFISFFLSEETNHQRQCVELCSHTQYCFIFRCLLCSESGCLASWCLHFLHFLMVALCIEVCGFSFIFHFPLMGFTLFLKVFCFFLFGVYCLSNLVSFFFLFCFMDKISCYIALFPSLVIFFLGVFWWIWSASLKGFFVYVAYFSYLFFFYKFYFTIYGVCLLVLYIYIYIYYSLTRVLFDVNNFLVFFPLIVYLVLHYLFNAKTAKKSISLQMRMWLRFFCNNWNFIMGSGLKFGKLGNYPCLILGLSNNLLFKNIRTL